MTTPAPAPTSRPQVAWSPSQTGPCASYHAPCARYGAPANPLCEACRAARRAQYGS